jgi:hypothetical protein
MSPSFRAVLNRGLAPYSGLSRLQRKRSVQFAFLGSGTDIGPSPETFDNAGNTLRRSRGAATTITVFREEKLRML